MSANPKPKALADARKAQTRFEKTRRQLDRDSEGRRESFERAKEAGATLREIGAAVGLHWTRIGNILGKK